MTEINRLFAKNCPLSCGSPFIGQRSTNWILTAAALAGSVASSIFGGAKAAKAARKAKQEQAYRSGTEKAWYDKQYNTDYLDTKAGQNLMRRAQEVQNDYIRKAEGSAAVGGQTAASVAQAKESANKTMGDTIANIAAQDTSRKAQVADSHMQNQMQQSQDRENLENQRAQNVSNAAQNMSNALMTAAGSLEGNVNTKSSSKLSTGANDSGTSSVTHNADTNPLVSTTASTDSAVQHAQNLASPDMGASLGDYAKASEAASNERIKRIIGSGVS